MGFWSNITRRVSDTYKKIDSSVGGYLPGGVKPGTTSTTPTTSTTSTKTGTTSGTNKTTSSSGGGGGGVYQGAVPQGANEQTFRTTGQTTSSYQGAVPQGANEQTFRTTGQTTSSNTITPSKSSFSTISPSIQTNEPPKIYERPVISAIGQSLRNTLNVGIIGQKGFGAYTQQAFFEPFEYVGKPKAYDKVGYNLNPEWRGTKIGGGGLSTQDTLSYTPEGFRDTTNQTWFDVGETKKRNIYSEAGLTYTGEPARLLPSKLQENIVQNIKGGYQDQYDTKVNSLYRDYQKKVDTGQLTQSQAQTSYETEIKLYETHINKNFQNEVSQEYSKRYGLVSNDLAKIEGFQNKIFEPKAYPIIRNVGRGVETTAIIGATTFGGSGVTFATSAYLGYKTASQGVAYKRDFESLTTSQKIVGGVSLGVGALATAYTFNLGSQRFYSEWRGIIYNDLSKANARVGGTEVLKTSELNRFEIASLKQRGVNQALTTQRVDVYQTGQDRVGFFSKGSTTTKIYDPQYEKYIFTTEKFTTSGNIGNIQQGNLRIGTKALGIKPEDVYGGFGKGIYSSSQKLKEFKFLSGSQSKGEYYNILGGESPKTSFVYNLGGNVKAYSTSVKAPISSGGRILKLQEESFGNYIVSSGSKSSSQFYKNLYAGGDGAVQQIKQVQQISLGSITTQATRTAPQITTSIQATGQTLNKAYSPQTLTIQEPKQNSSSITAQIPTLAQMGLQETKTNSKAVSVSQASFSALGLSQGSKVAQVQTQVLKVGQISKLKLRNVSGIIPSSSSFPGYFNPPNINNRFRVPPFRFDLNPGAINLPSNIVRGGQKRVNYSPSYSALLFNIRGSEKPKAIESGIGFRPITKGYKFNTGLIFKKRRLFF